ncbi:hypothetical protein COHA_007127 [Chlorella ohadii]|uniref:ribonuclease H n=1 Tax=Chlorella ohadii TaxID=2649997 RepID=A0AAD5DMM4_9CHLO|nr:hypothetical protein COHA_007127 [Chlorella ohadii]
MAKNFYAVASGRQRGLFRSWEQCQQQVNGYPKAVFKGFKTEEEARQYLRQHGIEVAGGGGGSTHSGAAAAAAAAAAAVGQPPLDGAAAQPRKRRAVAASGSSSAKKRTAAAPAAATAVGTAAAAAAGPAAASATDRVFRLEFDGASKRNPGPAGFGAVLYDEASGVEVARLCQYIGDHHTNNQAEYAGLIAGLAAALELGCSRLKVQGDSTLIINQVLGQWQAKNEGLRPWTFLPLLNGLETFACSAACCSGIVSLGSEKVRARWFVFMWLQRLARRFERFKAKQVLRQFNKVADALSNQAIDDYRSGANRQLWTLEAAAAAAADAEGSGAAGLAAELHAANAFHATEGDAAAAAAAAAGAGDSGSEGGGGGEERAKRARLDS